MSDLTLSLGWYVRNGVLAKQLARKLTAITVANNLTNAIALQQLRKFRHHRRRSARSGRQGRLTTTRNCRAVYGRGRRKEEANELSRCGLRCRPISGQRHAQ